MGELGGIVRTTGIVGVGAAGIDIDGEDTGIDAVLLAEGTAVVAKMVGAIGPTGVPVFRATGPPAGVTPVGTEVGVLGVTVGICGDDDDDDNDDNSVGVAGVAAVGVIVGIVPTGAVGVGGANEVTVGVTAGTDNVGIPGVGVARGGIAGTADGAAVGETSSAVGPTGVIGVVVVMAARSGVGVKGTKVVLVPGVIVGVVVDGAAAPTGTTAVGGDDVIIIGAVVVGAELLTTIAAAAA